MYYSQVQGQMGIKTLCTKGTGWEACPQDKSRVLLTGARPDGYKDFMYKGNRMGGLSSREITCTTHRCKARWV